MIEINGVHLVREYVKTSLEIRLKNWDLKESVYITGIPTYTFHGLLEDIGFSIDEGSLDINGWDGDYWIQAKYKEQDYTVAGSFFYGTHSVYLKED